METQNYIMKGQNLSLEKLISFRCSKKAVGILAALGVETLLAIFSGPRSIISLLKLDNLKENHEMRLGLSRNSLMG